MGFQRLLLIAACLVVAICGIVFLMLPPESTWTLNIAEDSMSGSHTQNTSRTKEPVGEEQKQCHYNLVVHIGPPKTGTTAVQAFLQAKKSWLEESFGIFSAGMSRDPKDPYQLPLFLLKKPNANSSIANEILQEINARLGKQDIILSSEAFTMLAPEHWENFKSRLTDSGRCLRLVMVHRRESDQLFSQWNQLNRAKHPPLMFGHFFLRVSEKFSTDYSPRLWKTASAAANAGVVGVSYEYLEETHCSFAVFLICNATLGREGISWRQCAEAIKSQIHGQEELQNTSPPAAALDVLRLAYGLHRQVYDDHSCLFNLNVRDAAIARVAQQMPTICGTFDAQFQLGEDEWFKQSGAARPTSKSKTTCLVDESKLTTSHWKLIKTTLPKCQASHEN